MDAFCCIDPMSLAIDPTSEDIEANASERQVTIQRKRLPASDSIQAKRKQINEIDKQIEDKEISKYHINQLQ